MHEHEVLHRLLRVADPAGGLEADDAAGLLVHVADRLEHHERDRQRRGARQLARRRLDEVGAGGHREQARAAHVVVGAELAGLEDHLQVRLAAGLLDAHDLVVDLRVAAGEERAAVDHHVDLVGALLDDPAHLLELRRERRLPGRERGRDRGDLDAAAAQALDGDRHEIRIDAHRGDRRDVPVRRIGAHGLRAERRDLARRVGALERREIHAADREVEREQLRLALDRALRELARASLDGDLVDRADPRQPRLERQLEPARKCGRLRHGGQCTLGASGCEERAPPFPRAHAPPRAHVSHVRARARGAAAARARACARRRPARAAAASDRARRRHARRLVVPRERAARGRVDRRGARARGNRHRGDDVDPRLRLRLRPRRSPLGPLRRPRRPAATSRARRSTGAARTCPSRASRRTASRRRSRSRTTRSISRTRSRC